MDSASTSIISMKSRSRTADQRFQFASRQMLFPTMLRWPARSYKKGSSQPCTATPYAFFPAEPKAPLMATSISLQLCTTTPKSGASAAVMPLSCMMR